MPANGASSSPGSCSISVIPECPVTNFLTKLFEERFSGNRPHCIVQAPGRVNLIGEHIDYAGYGVLPMAISKKVWIAFDFQDQVIRKSKVSTTNVCEVQHVDMHSFPSGSFSCDPQTNLAENHSWYSYVHCGYKGYWCLGDKIKRKVEKLSNRQDGCPMQILVHGTIPLAAGLSSSSALVVAATVASSLAQSSPIQSTLEDLADLARRAERYIGTMGGGMDQAISVLGGARRVDFDPLRTRAVPLPSSAIFVIANSMTSAEKAVGAHLCFNKRVVEMMVAAKVLATKLELADPLTFKTFCQVQEAYARKLCQSEVSLTTMIHAVKEHLIPGGYSEDSLNNIFSPKTWVNWFPHASQEEFDRIENVRKAATSYALYERALHVYSEADRVCTFETACINGAPLKTLGRLMNESHQSCAELYECSCPELDALVAQCRDLGALGSRLTGAGWGGSTVSLVQTDRVQAFMHGLKETYYANISQAETNFDEICFAAVPSPGVSLYYPPQTSTADAVT